MAPQIPDEIDVFTAPHSRMKELVTIYTHKMECADFRDISTLLSLLQDLHAILHEFKSHESIENMFIMEQLRNRLKQNRIYNSAVCNCHKDNRLTGMLRLVKEGNILQDTSAMERLTFGEKLQQTFAEFVTQFLPHMEEEEEVFQPLLVEYFEYDELKILKEVILEQHELIKGQCGHEKSNFETPEMDGVLKELRDRDFDFCSLLVTPEGDDEELPIIDVKYEPQVINWCESERQSAQMCHGEDVCGDNNFCPISNLPFETLVEIFSYLNPRDLIRCSSVTRNWNEAAMTPSLWRKLFPVQWARGLWEWKDEKLVNQLEDNAWKRHGAVRSMKWDEDADVDETNGEINEVCQREQEIMQALVCYVLPRVGDSVLTLVIDTSYAISSRLFQHALSLCPNLLTLSAAYTSLDRYAFKGLWKRNSLLKLTFVDLQGSELIDDDTLKFLSMCGIGWHDEVHPSGDQRCPLCPLGEGILCPLVTGHEHDIEEIGLKKWGAWGPLTPSLTSLNLSGCWRLSDVGLMSLVKSGWLNGLTALDLSGCHRVTSLALHCVTNHSRLLAPQMLKYCDNIVDVTLPIEAGGCANLGHPLKSCCRLGV